MFRNSILFSSLPFLATEIEWWLIGFLLIAYIIVIEKESLSSVGIRKLSKSTFSTAAIGFSLALLGVAAFGFITQLTGLETAGTEDQLNETGSAPWLMLFFFLVRAAPIEELIFRGFVISRAIDLGASRGFALVMSSFFVRSAAYFILACPPSNTRLIFWFSVRDYFCMEEGSSDMCPCSYRI